MARFHDVMNNFSGIVDLPDGFKEAISNAYDEDNSSSGAKITDLETQLVTKDTTINQLNNDYGAQVSSLKSANYDLLRAVPKDAITKPSDNKDDDLSGHDITIDDLFGKKQA